ncbi:MAG: hydroxymethylpyrimidine/phosphomethylpyrimidine kinase [Pseudomonadales bacterium]|nr:hydroxymethylpyrimidine/phosphomethylpyrimidine kinase [Pseudomonadales bacterium]
MRPVVLVIAGHDPTGGAGIQADIEAIHAAGGHAVTLITALTVQDTNGVRSFSLTPAKILMQQAEVLLADIHPQAIKLGMLGHPDTVGVVKTVLNALPGIPLVLDPVLAGNLSGKLSDASLPQALLALLPRTTLLTPNSVELDQLLQGRTLNHLFEQGVDHVLITGGHRPGPTLINELHNAHGCLWRSEITRIPGEFHGSGCTLASACAIGLAQGLSIPEAVQRAQHYTTATLERAYSPGRGQYLPWR